MALCRFWWDNSDVYIYYSDGGWMCCGCKLNGEWVLGDDENVVPHLIEHVNAGHTVPVHAFEEFGEKHPREEEAIEASNKWRSEHPEYAFLCGQDSTQEVAMSGERGIVERLRWWLRYFNDDTDKYKDQHPDYADNPAAFDETAIEADLREAANAIEAEKCGVSSFSYASDDRGIVERLRLVHVRYRCGPIAEQAADAIEARDAEIERLTRELEEAKRTIMYLEADIEDESV